jgi:protein-disulfide isomerase
MPAAKAAWAAGQQDQFWLYHDGLFVNQNRLGEDLYIELAEAMQLDMEQFNRDRASPEAEAAIQQDLELAQQLRLQGTPSFIMNDLLIPGGAPPQLFEEIFNQINALIKTKS